MLDPITGLNYDIAGFKNFCKEAGLTPKYTQFTKHGNQFSRLDLQFNEKTVMAGNEKSSSSCYIVGEDGELCRSKNSTKTKTDVENGAWMQMLDSLANKKFFVVPSKQRPFEFHVMFDAHTFCTKGTYPLQEMEF